MERYESWVDRQIREAQERGEFDDLPGAGRPIPGLKRHDPNWWVKGLIEREKISAPLPPGLALRREVEQLPSALADVRDEAVARELVEDLNRRILDLRRRPPEGVPVIVPIVDVEAALGSWRASR
ncbi:MAG: hypothetical protein AVDCRST_MAG48-793 [uncultured Friedmanniella sp.]|uniref:DnaJ homologue subfamily C member 28 conserved domain-containing protein n=1 Tax=uncultured Friedmanniella sp. TaxID=335381 RepID=A0A6J4K2M4_9ACTN|nr:MAG: hypothetical protein AVDCRST_MAG48-793 [uncultured Friedmanniella sp.]